MRSFVGGKNDVFVLEARRAEQVAERVVFFVECEDCGVGLARVGLHGYLGLAVAEEEELEPAAGLVG